MTSSTGQPPPVLICCGFPMAVSTQRSMPRLGGPLDSRQSAPAPKALFQPTSSGIPPAWMISHSNACHANGQPSAARNTVKLVFESTRDPTQRHARSSSVNQLIQEFKSQESSSNCLRSAGGSLLHVASHSLACSGVFGDVNLSRSHVGSVSCHSCVSSAPRALFCRTAVSASTTRSLVSCATAPAAQVTITFATPPSASAVEICVRLRFTNSCSVFTRLPYRSSGRCIQTSS